MLVIALLACSDTVEPVPHAEPAAKTAEPAEPAALVVYSGRSEALVGPLFAKIEAETGLDLQVQYGGTPELVTRFLTEGEESPADVIFAQDSGHLGVLAARHVLAPLPQEVLETVDPRYRDPEGSWVGTSGRLRVLVVDGESVPAAERPTTLAELADPKWKGRLGWAPSNGSMQAHVSALRHLWGEAKTKEWLAGVKANEPRTYPKNSPQVAAANSGEIAMGWVNHYYLHQSDKNGRRAVNHSFAPGDAGNVLMVSGVGIRKGSPQQEAAIKLVAALLSEASQTHFAQETFEYPTRPGVPTHADVPALDSAHLAGVKQEWLADLGPTMTLFQELGLQ